MIGRETTEGFGKKPSAMAEGSGALLWKGVAAMFTVETASPEETAALAERIGGNGLRARGRSRRRKDALRAGTGAWFGIFGRGHESDVQLDERI